MSYPMDIIAAWTRYSRVANIIRHLGIFTHISIVCIVDTVPMRVSLTKQPTLADWCVNTLNANTKNTQDYSHLLPLVLHDKEAVQILLNDSRVDPSTDDNYAIRGASANGHAGVVMLLLQLAKANGVDPSAADNEAIKWASEREARHVKVVRALLADNRVDPSAI